MTLKASLGELAGLRTNVRPQPLLLTCASVLYQDFDRIFLGGCDATTCHFGCSSGHETKAFDHNFFHMVKMTHETRGNRLDASDLIAIRAITEGFGPYEIRRERARALPSAHNTLVDPDEVVEGISGEGTATHCFLKYFGGGDNPYTFTLMKCQRTFMIPVTSYAGNAAKANKFRRVGRSIWTRPAS